MWRFLHRFYPQAVGHGSFPDVFADWLSNHVSLRVDFGAFYMI